VFTKLFSPASEMVRLDRSEAERLREVLAADRILRRERNGWDRSRSKLGTLEAQSTTPFFVYGTIAAQAFTFRCETAGEALAKLRDLRDSSALDTYVTDGHDGTISDSNLVSLVGWAIADDDGSEQRWVATAANSDKRPAR
jgi:hypothetical protein